MSEKQIQLPCEAPFEQLDIYVKRILAKYQGLDEQILFGESKEGTTPIDIKEALKVCVHNTGVTENNYHGYSVKCITDIKVVNLEADEEIICNHKVKLVLKFKVVLFVTFTNNCFGCIVLPDDAMSTNPDAKACFITDIEERPQTIGNNECLEIIDDACGKMFKWTKSIPLSEFEGEIPSSAFTDPTLQTHLIIKSITSDYDVLGEFTCGTSPVIYGTEVHISVFVDLLDKLGIDQDILICGVPYDC